MKTVVVSVFALIFALEFYFQPFITAKNKPLILKDTTSQVDSVKKPRKSTTTIRKSTPKSFNNNGTVNPYGKTNPNGTLNKNGTINNSTTPYNNGVSPMNSTPLQNNNSTMPAK